MHVFCIPSNRQRQLYTYVTIDHDVSYAYAKDAKMFHQIEYRFPSIIIILIGITIIKNFQVRNDGFVSNILSYKPYFKLLNCFYIIRL